MTQATKQAIEFILAANAAGFNVVVASDNVVRITSEFTPGDAGMFTECDMMAGSVLAMAPLKGGSVWGTDGGSVGGMVALKSGKFVMNKSGTGARFMKALKQIIGS